ncbi:hypothetical protein PENTCL1PPCAC_15311, partial [Pristionchus entomophagus]
AHSTWSSMQAERLMLLPLLVLFLARDIEGFVYSCEEVKYRLANQNFALNTTFACVFTLEGFNNWGQLKQLQFAGYSTNFADIGQPGGCISKRKDEPSWRVIADTGET